MHTVHPSSLAQVQQLIPVKQAGLLHTLAFSDRKTYDICRIPIEVASHGRISNISAVTMRLPYRIMIYVERQCDTKVRIFHSDGEKSMEQRIWVSGFDPKATEFS